MFIFYGMDDCSGCQAAKAAFAEAGVKYEFRAIGERVTWMKEFLAYRDHEPMFEEIRKEGRIGIPFFVTDKGELSHDVEKMIAEAKN